MADPQTMSPAQLLLKDAHRSIVGIDESGNVFGGYDQVYPHASHGDEQSPEWSDPRMTRSERIELADEMIRRWNEYRKRASQVD